MKVLRIFLVLFIFSKCNFSTQDYKLDENKVKITLRNTSLKIPKADSLSCSDTLVFILNNESEIDYYFIMDDSTVNFFSYWDVNHNAEIYSDVSTSVLLRFTNNENKVLNPYLISPFNPDVFKNSINKNRIKKLPKKSSKIFKKIIKFPNITEVEGLLQFIPDLQDAVSVEIYFMPKLARDDYLLNYHRIKFTERKKYLNYGKKFVLPIEFICDYSSEK